jgi:hypothetical protein
MKVKVCKCAAPITIGVVDVIKPVADGLLVHPAYTTLVAGFAATLTCPYGKTVAVAAEGWNLPIIVYSEGWPMSAEWVRGVMWELMDAGVEIGDYEGGSVHVERPDPPETEVPDDYLQGDMTLT